MKNPKLIIAVLAVPVAFALVALLPLLPSQSQGFADRIVRPCSAGAVTQSNVIANPNGNGNINVTPCTGGSLTVNGVAVIPNGLPDPGSNGFVVRTAANTTVARTIGGSNGISISNGTGVAGNPDIAGVNAAADGATKGVSAYNANDFNAAAGIITLDYTNGQAASAVLKGYLTSADWSTFNAKQPAGSYITALTGDGTAAGPGSVAFTLANMVAAGSCTSCNLTYDAKGRITAAANGASGITNSAGANVVPISDGTNLNGGTAGANQITAASGAISIDSGAGSTIIGDTTGAVNGTMLTVDDSAQEVAVNVPVFISGNNGLTVGGNLSFSNTGKTIGNVNNPVASLFIGNAANNSSQITGTFTGNRVHTLPDITGTIVLSTAATVDKLSTTTNCADSAGAAACGSAAAGSVVIDAGATTVVVSTTAVSANSQIFVQYDSSLGARLGITCNTTPALPAVTARTAATSFTVTVPVSPITNPACYSYFIVN